MCGACYQGFADVAGTSAPFLAAGTAVTWQKVRKRLGITSDDPGIEQSEQPVGDDVLTG